MTSAHHMGSTDDRFYMLDGLRGLAAVIVVIYHFNAVGYRVAEGGYLAVDFFFALSGLVLASAYEGRFADGLRTAGFMRLRLIRLYPLFLAGIALGVVHEGSRIALADPAAWPSTRIAASAALGGAMLPDPLGNGALYPLNTPAWSLLFELVANTAFALVLTRWSARALMLLAAGALAYLALQGWLLGTIVFGDHWSAFDIALARVTAMFAIGMICARRRPPAPRRRRWWALLPVAAFVAVLTWPIGIDGRWPIDLALAAIATPALLLFGMRIDLPLALQRVAAWLGDISYPIYAVHAPLLFFWHLAAARAGWPPVLEIAGFVVVMLAVATALVPVDARVRAWLARPPQHRRRLRPAAVEPAGRSRFMPL